MKFSEIYLANFRGSILVILDAANVECSMDILRGQLSATSPHRVGMSQLKQAVVWLKGRNLVEYVKIDGVINGLVITDHGNDVAQGRVELDGVDIPGED